MINIKHSNGSSWPANFMLVPRTNIGLPELAQAYDYHRVAPTSAVGNANQAICGAVGEFMERRHFYNEVTPEKELTISEMMPEIAALSYIDVMQQTALNDFKGSIQSHRFQSNSVFNLFSHEFCHIPSIFISMSNHGLEHDNGYLPNRDTTGCAAHICFEKSLDGSLKELVERQCLLRYWLTKHVKKEIVINSRPNCINDNARVLIDRLQRSGKLKLYDITIPDMPGYAVICLYGSSDSNSTIQYCTGLSYDHSAANALEKSLIELWQSFSFLHYSKVGGYDIDDIDDSYHKHFWLSNKYETFSIMTDVINSSSITLDHFIGQPTSSRLDLEYYLKTITNNLFVYARKEALQSSNIYFTRVLSPDLFIHMDCSSPINFNNKLSCSFPKMYEERKSNMVPFP